MALTRELESQGNWLFRWRSYLPLIGVPVVAGSIANASWPLGSYRLHEWWDVVCFVVSLLGLAIRIHVVGHAPMGTSGRNTSAQLALSLNTTGMYSVVRHPLYLGNYLIALGAVLVPFVWWLPLLFTFAFWLYYERIMFAEEAYLRRQFLATFSEWSQDTPAFVPNLMTWTPAAEPFSVRFVLRKEYTGLAVVVLLHAGVEAASHLAVDHRLELGRTWEILLAAGATAYIMLRYLKRHTKLLDVPER